MEAIRQLEEEGYNLTTDGNQIHYRLRDGAEPKKEKVVRLFAEVKAHKVEAISFLKACHDDQSVKENIGLEPDMRTINVFSKVLDREVFVSWEGDNPERVLFDGIPYTVDEIAELKKIPVSPDDLRAIHDLKATFEGVIMGGASRS